MVGLPRVAASYLCVFEGVHDEDGEAQSEDVGQEAGVEVGPGVPLQAADVIRTERDASGQHGTETQEEEEEEETRLLPHVEAQQQGDEDPWDDDVSQSQHGKVTGFQSFLQ